MAQVKIGFRGLSIPDKVQKAGNYVICMKDNPVYPSPIPTLVEVQGKADLLESSYKAALDGGKALKASMYQREKELDECISQLGAYVQSGSGGDAEKIRSAGFDVKTAGTTSGDLAQPVNLQAFTSKRAGEISLDWDSVDGAKSYTVEKSSDGSTGWVSCGNNTRSDMVVQNLPSLSYAYFRVAAIGTAGQSPWSETAKGLVS